MSAFDLALRGGTVVSGTGRAELDVYVLGERIAALGPRGAPAEARSTLDASGCFVLPGMVDTHVHLMEPGDPSREDFPTGTAAALRQGVTTIVEHTHSWPVTSPERYAEKLAHLAGRSHVDFGLAAHVWPDRDDLEALWHAGVVFFKIFTCSTHGVPGLTGERLAAAFEAIGRFGGSCLVHCEDELLTAGAENVLRELGRDDPGILPEWRSREAELAAVHLVGLLSRASGASVTVAHASSAEVLETIEWHRRHGAPLVAETCPQYLLLWEREVHEHGALRKFTPPARLRSTTDEEAMWAAFNAGAVHHLSTDHAPSTLAQKAAGSIWDVHFGLPGLDTTLPLMLDAALRGRTSLERVVEAYASAPARRYGLRRKGRVAPGFDADLVVVDPRARRVLSDAAVVSKAGWTPYAGREVVGAVTVTVLRGRVVARDGELTEEPRGRHLPGPGAPPR
ncbi:MAG TPA: dihydroorotase family protein [Acidimicrobiales bacterium]|nr:dihydroorotase family protein [Acidimicrobiales bacterium]